MCMHECFKEERFSEQQRYTLLRKIIRIMGAFIVHLQSDQRILAARFKETRKPLYKHMQNAPPMTRKKEAKPTDIAHKSTHTPTSNTIISPTMDRTTNNALRHSSKRIYQYSRKETDRKWCVLYLHRGRQVKVAMTRTRMKFDFTLLKTFLLSSRRRSEVGRKIMPTA